MKKIIALALVLVFALALAIPTFAAATNFEKTGTSQDGETTVSYNVSGSYTLEIPSTLEAVAEIPQEAGVDNLTVSGIMLYKGTTLTVSASYTTMHLENDAGTTVPFTLYADTTEKTTGAVLLTQAAGTAGGANIGTCVTAYVDTANIQYAGEYTGTITFTLNVTAQA